MSDLYCTSHLSAATYICLVGKNTGVGCSRKGFSKGRVSFPESPFVAGLPWLITVKYILQTNNCTAVETNNFAVVYCNPMVIDVYPQ